MDGNFATMMGKVKNKTENQVIIDDGTGSNVACNVEFDDMIESINVGSFVEVQGQVAGPAIEVKCITQVTGVTQPELRAKVIKAMKPHRQIFYVAKV